MSHSNQRHKYLVDREVQGGLLGKAAGYWMLSLAVVGSLNVVGWIFVAPGVDALVRIREQIPSFVGILVVALVSSMVVLPVVLYDLVKYSNRFAGPIHRLQRSLQAVANGDQVAPLSFRDDDYWQELAEHFNRVVARLSETDRSATEEVDDDYSAGLNREFVESAAK